MSSDHETRNAFQPSLEQCAEIWRLARQAWELVSDLDEAIDGSEILGAALQEIYAVQLRAMKPLIELGVFRPLTPEDQQLLKDRNVGLAPDWEPPVIGNGAS